MELNKTYRSTPEIIEHTNKILNLKHVSAIRRENQRPVLFRDNILDLKTSLLKDINLLKKEHFSVAIITKDDSESEKVYELLKNDVKDINILNSNTKNFNKKMVIIPSYIAKGLEFDSVIIYTEKENFVHRLSTNCG